MNERRATLLGGAAILLWSSTVAFARSLSESVGTLTSATLIYGLSSIVAAGVHWYRTGRLPRPRFYPSRFLVPCGSLFVLYMAALFISIGQATDHRQVLEIGLINYLWPALTVALSIPILGRRANALIIPGLALAVFGIGLVTTQDGPFSLVTLVGNARSNPLAYGSALLAAVSWALYSVLSRRLSSGGEEGAVTIFLLGTSAVLCGLRLSVVEVSSWSPAAVVEITYMACVTSLGYAFWDIAVRQGRFGVVSTAAYFTPFFSTVITCLYLGVVPTAKLWAGCLLLVAAAYISAKGISKDAASPRR